MLGFVVNNPVSRFVGNQFTKVGNWFEKENKEFETNEELRTSKHSRLTAARIVMKKLIAENNEYLSKENFDSSKKILEDVTGLTNLTYDEHECDIIDGGLTLDLAGIKPKITIYKASALTKEEMIVLCPELKEIHIVPQKPLKKEEDKKEEVKAEEKKQETADTKDNKSEVKEEAKPEEKKVEKPAEVKEENSEEVAKPEESKTEEKPSEKEEVKKIDPEAPADLGLKTQEQIAEEKKVVVEIKPTTTEEKVEQAVCEGYEKGEVKIVAPSKKEEKPVNKKPEAEAKEETKEVKKDEKPAETVKPTVMVTFADKVKEGFSKFENEIFDKTIAKFSNGAKEGKLKFDIKITDVLVKKCDKENKIVTFVFVNDNKQYPLLETFYYTGNNKQSTTPFTDVNSFIKAHKERNEAAKKDEKLKSKCYNIKYSTIPGYAAPAK